MNSRQVTQPAVPADSLEQLAILNKAASDPLRLDVLRLLHNSSYGVLELCHILDVKQSGLSHHLKILSQAGLVSSRREGNSVFYTRCQPRSEFPLLDLQLALFSAIDRYPVNDELVKRARHIQQARASRSEGFFKQNAGQFEQQQELIATHSLYGNGVRDLLDATSLTRFRSAIEVGPGNGDFLPELSSRFEKVTALDNSSEMLDKARQFCEQQQLSNIEFNHSDTATAASQQLQADCVVINMVLHHTPSPADIFNDLFELTANNGVLLLTELCPHDQDWVQDACGDIWFGFEPEELTNWASASGFTPHQSVFHALRNGFQIQLHSFCKTPFHSNTQM